MKQSTHTSIHTIWNTLVRAEPVITEHIYFSSAWTGIQSEEEIAYKRKRYINVPCSVVIEKTSLYMPIFRGSRSLGIVSVEGVA